VSKPAKQPRRAADARGRWAETLVALWLWAKGYKIVARRLQTGFGEIDILALSGRTLVVVEVKARSALAPGTTLISPHQQQRLGRAALVAARDLRLSDRPLRFDLVVVPRRGWPRHHRGCFDGAPIGDFHRH
jgi:putative endonuclease